MNNITANDNIVYIKKYIDKSIVTLLKGRTLDELTNQELIELNETIVYFNDILSQKLEIQEIELDSLKNNIRKKINNLSNRKN